MRCDRCGKEYPSLYYFKAGSVCNDCYEKLRPEEQAALHRPSPIQTMTTTAFTIDGFRIAKSLGVVRGIVVRSRSVFGTIGASLQTLVGGLVNSSHRAEVFIQPG